METELLEVLSLKDLDDIVLRSGDQETRGYGVCAMEAVAWLAGEPHSSHPDCSCPVAGTFMISWNDGIRDTDTRSRLLKPLLPLLVASKSTAAVELQRSYLAFDWLIRVQVPAWLDLTPSLKVHADLLRALPAVKDKASSVAASGLLDTARNASRDEWTSNPLDAVRTSAGDAARNASRNAARNVAGDAAGAGDSAGDSAGGSVWATAVYAARAATGDAAGDAAVLMLRPTVEQLRISAGDLVRRMVAITE